MCCMLKDVRGTGTLVFASADGLGSRPVLVGKEEGNCFLHHQGAMRTPSAWACILSRPAADLRLAPGVRAPLGLLAAGLLP